MYDLPDLDRFVEVRPGLFRCTIIWPLGLGINIPVSTFLVRGDPLDKSADPAHDWLLVDSGAPMQVATLLKAIDAVLTHEKDTLRYICITHAHIDHTGAATALLEKYPGSKVVIHVEEMPFICEGKSFKTCAGDTWTFTLLKTFSHEADVRIPQDRTVTLRDGDKWEFEHVLKFVETQGHTPGSASYLHIPSRSIMVGDAVMNIASNPLFSKIPCISGPLVMSTCHWGNAMKSIDKILSLKEDIDTVFPAHDYNVDGVHIDKVHEFHCPPTRL
ncbi:hypothetical protein MVEG_03707 [Podila verticillata NRRL 6337]|nr:MAG: beta-lactamase-like protein [Podila humilis]KFH70860.1 hypothetical protein MVEG_03707 [Podila verticillata NRRL 6337]